MSGKREIACGVDVHNKFIVATILSSDGLKLQDRFETSLGRSFEVQEIG